MGESGTVRKMDHFTLNCVSLLCANQLCKTTLKTYQCLIRQIVIQIFLMTC